MKTFWTKLTAFFAKLFTRDFWSRVLQGIETASPYLEVAYEFVSVAAQMTPNRTDDELIALANKLGVPAILQSQDKGTAIRDTVAAALKTKFPSLSTSLINRAIELAYGALRP